VHSFPLSYGKAITKVLKGAASADGRVVFVLSGRLLLFLIIGSPTFRFACL
jgi:hypothetical protein